MALVNPSARLCSALRSASALRLPFRCVCRSILPVLGFLALWPVSLVAAATTLTFTSDAGGSWSDGIANDGEGGSSNIAGITIEILNISDTNGTNLVSTPIEWYNNTDLGLPSGGFTGLTTFSYAVGDGSWKGISIRGTSGAEFQLNQFTWYDWGDFARGTVNVIGYRNSSQVASTSFTSNTSSAIVTVNLDSTFDNVDEVRITYATVTGWPSINGIVIDSAVPAPTVTDAKISISGASGTGGAFKINDTVTATWNNTAGGDNNSGITGVTVDFSQFGGGSAVTASNNSGTWTATYPIVAGAIDATNRNVSVSATSASGTTTTADTTNATVDNVAPTITFSSLAFSADTGTSSSDFITKTAAQTITATLSGAPAGSDIVYGSLDNGSTWTDITSKVSGTSLSWNGVTLASSNTLRLRVTDDAGNNGSSASQAYTLDTSAPSAPNLSAGKAAPNSSTINLSWDVPSTTSTFTLRRSTSAYPTSISDGTMVQANIASSTTSLSETSLADSTYYYAIFALDVAGNVSPAGTASATIDTTAPSAPTLLASKPTANGSTINLSWDVPSDTASFTLRRSTTSAPTSITDGTLIQSNIASSTTSLSQTGLADGTYYYAIFALDAYGNVSNAGASSAVTVDTTPPSAPTLSAAKPSATSNTINLSWDAPSTTVTFTLRRSTTSAPTSIADGTLIQSNIASSTTSLSQAGLSDGTYYYAIFALDAFGNVSNAGAAASVTIDTTAPDTPAAFVASTTGSTVALSWVNPVSDFASCTIRRSTSAYPTSITDGTVVGSNLTGTSLNQTSLADGTYYYAIFALDAFGNVSNAGTASVMVDTTATSAPAFFSAVASGSSVALSWTNPVAGDFSSCTIRRSASAYPTTVTGGTSVAANLTGTSRVDTGLADGTYYYAIFALDAFGNVSVAATASVTVDTTAPVIGTQPTGGTYAAGASFTLTVAATDSAALTYQWYLGANPVSNDTNRAGATTASLTLTNVTTTGFNGSYTVVVTDSAGNATTSSAANITVNKAAATVTLSNLAVTYTGSPQSATATTLPGGLTVVLTYDGSPTAPTNAGTYAVVGTINEANYLGTASGTLVISYVAPAITVQPASRGVLAGSNAVFTVAVTGAPAPTFQWQRLPAGSGTWANQSDGGGYSGTTTATLTVGNVTDGMNGGQFRCVVTNVAGSTTSTAATLTVGIISPSDAVITFAVE